MRKKLIGRKHFEGVIDITDPCYDRNVWCRMNTPLGKNKILIAEKDYFEDRNEFRIYIKDVSTGVETQNIALIRKSLKNEDAVECLVWGDKNNDDYTDRFVMDFCDESGTMV